jgi:Tfp pilus assembly protein PilE
VSASIKDQRGVSLVELNFSVAVMGIIAVSLLAVITTYFMLITRTNAQVDMTTESQRLLRTMTEELRYGAGVRQMNTLTDANAPPGGWNTSNDDFVIIVAVPAQDSDRNYIVDPLTGSPYMNELVYFKDGQILYRRTLADPDASGNRLTTTCPAASATSSCPADVKLAEDLEDMNFTLYDQDNATTADPLLARSVLINLGLQRESFGKALMFDNSVRITLRNVY